MRHLVVSIFIMMICMMVTAGEVKVHLTGARPDTVVVNVQSYAERVSGMTSVDWMRMAVTGDTIAIKADDTELMEVSVWPLDQEYNYLRVLVGPDDSVTAEVTDRNFRGAKCSGTPFIESLNMYSKEYAAHIETDRYKNLSYDDKLMDDYLFTRDYVLNHRDEDISVYKLQRMPLAMAATVVDSISDRAASEMLQPLYEVIRRRVDEYRTAERIRERNRNGGMAPDFMLTDINGAEVSLSQFAGKWVLLDFWATWCKWCIKGFPELQTFMEQCGDRCTIISLSVDDHREIWKEYLREHPQQWIALWVDARDQSEANPRISYAVESLPTKFLISPDGTIALYEVGENPEFLDKVKSLIGTE